MKNALIRMTAFLLVLILLTGCSSDSSGETKKDSSKKTQTSMEIKKPTDDAKEETKPAETDKPTGSAKNETKPAETAEPESKAPSTEDTKEETPADLYMEAVRISEENRYGEQGAYGFFDHVLMEELPTYNVSWEKVFLYFSDRQYCLEYDRDSGEVKRIALHSDGQNWTTTYYFGMYVPIKVLNVSDKVSNLANAYYFILSYYANEIEETPEQIEYNGISCWRFSFTDGASSSYPEGSVMRTRILFRQEDLIFVYARKDVVTPDGTEIPIVERHVLSGKETEEFYQTHAQDFADVENRDSSGIWTLTMIVDPGEKNERTFYCPMNAGEDLNILIGSYTPYWDREGTRKINAEYGSADLDALIDSATDTTIYLIR